MWWVCPVFVFLLESRQNSLQAQVWTICKGEMVWETTYSWIILYLLQCGRKDGPYQHIFACSWLCNAMQNWSLKMLCQASDPKVCVCPQIYVTVLTKDIRSGNFVFPGSWCIQEEVRFQWSSIGWGWKARDWASHCESRQLQKWLFLWVLLWGRNGRRMLWHLWRGAPLQGSSLFYILEKRMTLYIPEQNDVSAALNHYQSVPGCKFIVTFLRLLETHRGKEIAKIHKGAEVDVNHWRWRFKIARQSVWHDSISPLGEKAKFWPLREELHARIDVHSRIGPKSLGKAH